MDITLILVALIAATPPTLAAWTNKRQTSKNHHQNIERLDALTQYSHSLDKLTAYLLMVVMQANEDRVTRGLRPYPPFV